MKNRTPRTKDQQAEFVEHAVAYCRAGESAAMYLYGIADGFEAAGSQATTMIARLRTHAAELSLGTMFVEHDYLDSELKLRGGA